MAVQLRKLLERTALYYLEWPNGTLGQPQFFPVEPTVDTGAYLGPDETAVASWVQKNNKHAGATTNTLPNAKCLYLAVRGRAAPGGGGYCHRGGPGARRLEKNLMLAIVDECGLVLEKELLGQEKHRVEEQAQQEVLRANLLRAISPRSAHPADRHFRQRGHPHGERLRAGRGQAAAALHLHLRRLHVAGQPGGEPALRLRIENGTIRLKMEPELLEEVFQEALTHLDRKAKEHTITGGAA